MNRQHGIEITALQNVCFCGKDGGDTFLRVGTWHHILEDYNLNSVYMCWVARKGQSDKRSNNMEGAHSTKLGTIQHNILRGVFTSTPYANQKETALSMICLLITSCNLHPSYKSDKILRQSETKHYTNLLNIFKIQILCSHVPHNTFSVDNGPHI